MKKYLFVFLLFPLFLFGQSDYYKRNYTFSQADTLRGMLMPARTCYDVKHYALDIKIDPENRFISGYVDMTFEAVNEFLTLQVDLFSNMEIDEVLRLDNNTVLETKRKFNAVFINMGERISKGSRKTIRIFYSGQPIAARNAPWDGGFVWDLDDEGRDWIGVACEGDGASLWWPNKDHLSDEPDSMDMAIAVPSELTCVSNGRFLGKEEMDGDFTRYLWKVSYPINNYNVTVNIGHYTHFSDTYKNKEGKELELDYYVIDYNLEKAKKHFRQVKPTLECFEHYFGEYPFWRDGYALVETPYLGMEHQGAIAYGNQYKRGYLGRGIPSDMDFDYIIIHETGHEYFGNSISCNDHAEMWLHESFTTYMEALYVECTMGYEDAIRYLNYQKRNIANLEPIIGPMDVNWTQWRSSDQYYKGSWILSTLRHAINNDELWFGILREFHEKYKIKNVVSSDFFRFVNEKTGKNYDAFFKQYLYYPSIPDFVYSLKKKGSRYLLKYKWETDVDGFDMPVAVKIGKEKVMLTPTCKWQKALIKPGQKSDFKVLEDLFLIKGREVKN